MPDFAALYRQAAGEEDLAFARRVVASAAHAARNGLMTDQENQDLYTEVRANPMFHLMAAHLSK